jgi:N utilization substance protein A
MQIDDLNLPERVTNLLSESGYSTVGDLMLQLQLDSDAILSLNGIGPKSMEEISTALAEITWPEAEAVEIVEAVTPLEEPEAVEVGAAIVEPEAELIEEIAEVEAPIEVELVEAPAVEEAPIEALEFAEAQAEPEMAPAAEVELAEGVAVEKEEELPTTLDELFTLKPEVFDVDLAEIEDEEEEEGEAGTGKKKKKKKKKFVEMEYDPDKDVVIVKRKRKRAGSEWDDEWSL